MKVLLINGSPHEKGSTYTALAEVEKSLHKNGVETVWYQLGKGAYHSCTACGYCRKNDRTCVFDDGANECRELLKQADGVVIGSPVYYAGPNGGLCAMLDRVFYSAGGGAFAGKVASSVAVCRRAGTTATIDRLNKYFQIGKMPVASSQYWNVVHGSNGEQVQQDAEGMQTMRVLGDQMAWMLKSFEKSVAPPELEEPREWTNFIR